MKKVNWAIFAASLFITGVMGYLMWSGVHLKERRMVKWSDVSSPEEAGTKLARFMYPILGEYNGMVFEGKGEFAERFFSAFKKEEDSRNRGSYLAMSDEIDEGLLCSGFLLKIYNIDNSDEFCKPEKVFYNPDGSPNPDGTCPPTDSYNPDHCIANKARKKFLKKPRDKSKYWINLYRYDSNRAVIFYKGKSP